MYNLSSIKIIEFCSIIAIIYKEFNFRLNFRTKVCGLWPRLSSSFSENYNTPPPKNSRLKQVIKGSVRLNRNIDLGEFFERTTAGNSLTKKSTPPGVRED